MKDFSKEDNMAANTEEKSFEKQVTQYIRNLERRALEADITDMDENAETAHIDVFRGGRVVTQVYHSHS